MRPSKQESYCAQQAPLDKLRHIGPSPRLSELDQICTSPNDPAPRMPVQWSIAGPVLGLGIAAIVLGRSWATQPSVHIGSNQTQQRAFARSPLLNGKYKVRSLLSSGHVETIFAALFRRPGLVRYDRTILKGPDGGTTAVDASAAKVGALTSSADALSTFRASCALLSFESRSCLQRLLW